MRDDHHRAGIAAQKGFKLAFAGQIEMVIRLVEQQHVGRLDGQPGQHDQFFLPAAQILGQQVKITRRKAEPEQNFAHGVGVAWTAQPIINFERAFLLFQHAGQLIGVVVDARIGQPCFDLAEFGFDLGEFGRQGGRFLPDGPARRQVDILREITHMNARAR